MGLRKDPLGFFCLALTYGIVIFSDYCFIVHTVMPVLSASLWGSFHIIVFNVFVFLLVYSHFVATTADPGFVPLPTIKLDFSDQRMQGAIKTPQGSEWSLCTKCETYRPPRAHHCRTCSRCIRKMDHHCPWINNCVGECNQKYFILFLLYTAMASVYAIIFCIVLFMAKCDNCDENSPRHNFFDDIDNVCVRLRFIYNFNFVRSEYVKKENRSRILKSKMALLSEVFGRGSYWTWLLPFCGDSASTTAINTMYEV
ncbi:Palmitoyltransferase ZDHHC7 [Trichoplax sp. H2]|nr:Palmitoyltransferase ZDHHC7 [Trichoplax sp. H2]|eukprot:RDD41752.1 Palmitoyltransferase ZDHHC7 [Trichoplax sp. H2]